METDGRQLWREWPRDAMQIGKRPQATGSYDGGRRTMALAVKQQARRWSAAGLTVAELPYSSMATCCKLERQAEESQRWPNSDRCSGRRGRQHSAMATARPSLHGASGQQNWFVRMEERGDKKRKKKKRKRKKRKEKKGKQEKNREIFLENVKKFQELIWDLRSMPEARKLIGYAFQGQGTHTKKV